MALDRSFTTLRGRLVGGALAIAVGLSAGLATAEKAPPPAAQVVPFDMKDALFQGNGLMQAIAGAVTEANQLVAQLSAEASVAKTARVQGIMRVLSRLVSLAERAHQLLQKAVASGNAKRAEREFVKLSVAHQRVLDLLAQIRAEAGSTSTSNAAGDAEVQTLRDSDMPITDPQEAPSAIDVITVDTGRPPTTSPFN